MSQVARTPPTAIQPIRVPVYPKQRDFILCQKRMRAFTGGVGSGKSRSGAIDILTRSRPNSLYMVVAPTYKMLDRATFRTFKDVAEMLGLWPGESGYYKQDRRVVLRNGSEHLFCSSEDPDSLRGPNASGVWGDEMQEAKEDAYMILLGRLREHGVPGWISLTFTPGSPDHWTSREFINSTNPDVAFFRASLGENIFLDPEFYAGMLRSYAASPMRIRRELEGECVYLEGAEWLPEYFDNAGFDSWPDAERGGIRVISLDPSKGKSDKSGDYSAFVMIWFVNGKLYLDADMRNDRDDITICQTGVDLFRAFQPHYFVLENESHQNDHLIRDMHRIADREGLIMPITPVTSEKVDKRSRIRRLAGYVSERWFRFKNNSPGAKILRDQLMAFPLGHDDGPDSLAHGISVLQKVTSGLVMPPTGYGLSPMGQIITPNWSQGSAA